MGTVADVLRIAEGEVGYSRWDDPNPGTKYGRWYAQITGSPYFGTSGVPYCAMFVSWDLAQANVQCEGFPRAVAIDPRDGFNRMVKPSDLQPGDPVGFDWDGDAKGDHVGITMARSGHSVLIATIEGNTGGGRVLKCERNIAQVTCGVRPYYDDAESPAKALGKLDVDGVAGPNTVTLFQRQVGTADDGVISGQYYHEDRYRRNVWSVDHNYEGSGSDLVYALQCKFRNKGTYHGNMDRCWGYNFTDAMQRELKEMGYYTGGFDHDFAQHSVKALQMSLNDGAWEQI
jgi:hypothetical protein